MKLDDNLLEGIAANARVALTEKEKEEFLPQLKEILDMFEVLRSADSDQAAPSFQPIEVKNVWRDDKAEPSFTLKEVFADVQNREEHFFKGPKAI